ncbi:hypothetical protein [Actinomycetospora soli]|uniref:hypothetical protein n=1 Tax=Actinomycetospora soli TaxID=2893887 RepID=UPI001E4787DF|nr:hypothetical protein [Actinomycetospora soli]MCD2185955.1 hypothetical protein [Actinomycetospora soli]
MNSVAGWVLLGLGLLVIPLVCAVLTHRLLRSPVWAWQAVLARTLSGVPAFLGIGAVTTIVLSYATGLPEDVGAVAAVVTGVLVAGSVCFTARGLRVDPREVSRPDAPAGA